ncbi:MAG: hypothetical protein IT384_25485 [Deltaproteobacteria bacterium]|nr:hypothetical protein [Deltaproteobacteria bacterium]
MAREVARSKAIVAIDTSVIRDVVERDPSGERWPELGRCSARFRFTIFDANLLELARQIRDEPAVQQSWFRERHRLAPPLDAVDPVLSITESPKWKGTREEAAQSKTGFVVLFRHLVQKECPNSLGKSLRKVNLDELLRTSHGHYTDLMRRMSADIRGGKYGDRKELAEDNRADDHAPIYFKLITARAIEGARPRGPYNPEKRPNDSPDTRLVGTLDFAPNARVITNDRNLIRRVHEVAGEAVDRIHTLSEFVSGYC